MGATTERQATHRLEGDEAAVVICAVPEALLAGACEEAGQRGGVPSARLGAAHRQRLTMLARDSNIRISIKVCVHTEIHMRAVLVQDDSTLLGVQILDLK